MSTVSLTQHDWSLHRKGAMDQARHKQKVKEAVRQNLADIVSEQSIITSDGKKVVRVPIRTLDEYKFRFDPSDQQQVGEGNGGSKVGDVLERYGKGQGPGQGPQAGDQPGVDYYEAELTMEELAGMVFEDLCLPNLEEKRMQELESETVRFTDIRKSGPYANLDKRRTIRENIKRNAKQGQPHFGALKNDDLRFKTWERSVRRESNAVVIAMMDVSGSMGTFEKYVSRAFYYWMVRFLRTRYDNVKIVFIAHHTEAKEVTEEEFFTRGESGGTKASSAYQLALSLVEERYDPGSWNIYPFHFSDGDNWPSDNELCRQLADRLVGQSNLFGYGEIRQGRYSYQSTLMHTFQQLSSPKFVTVTIADKAEVYPALRRFFGPEVGVHA
ncbi:MAG TPA: sporulation protein YhbH [Thermomicrobiaceae bacterium]|nr:sporulation protein YhbH [Thermomicrobiaceae bacterium]